MPTVTFEYRTEAERLSLECAFAFVSEMHQLAQSAPDGQVLQACESQALDKGRALIRSSLQQAVQARIAAAEAKGGRLAPAPARPRSASRDAVSGR